MTIKVENEKIDMVELTEKDMEWLSDDRFMVELTILLNLNTIQVQTNSNNITTFEQHIGITFSEGLNQLTLSA